MARVAARGRRPCERAGEPEYLSNRCAYDRIRHDMRSFKSFATTRSAARISMLVLLCTLVWLGNGRGADAQLDASWTPSGDGPLPLSDNYRSTLRKLCRLLEKDKLPPKLASSRSTIVSQCEQLREADAAGGSTYGSGSPVPGWVLGVGAVVVAGMMLADRARGGNFGGQALGGGDAGGAAAGANDAELRARRARFLDQLGGGDDLAASLRRRQAAS